ncbi:AraC family transcriptional regulator [Paenibacillus nanensis]|uniref:AraC family transcriptional regulator n=1 Tax=Paenibacillus nanensis TaxID=393251 RepID=A0A3A1VGJ7_9BACL|nr:AraC family transcriptional regulator [Paenibacillus nanensis]RIX59385.1 AraC family transcriptional regulator [Paenibacillus nanensis]
MVANSTNMGILNELSESITVRLRSIYDPAQSGDWYEHKAHPDYDLWFIQEGIVNIRIEGIEHTAHPGDVVFFYPGVPYRASTSSGGCRFIYTHFDFAIGEQQRILGDFQLSGIIPKALILEEADLFKKSYLQTKRSDGVPGNRLYVKACLTAVVAKMIELHGQGRYTGQFMNKKSPRKNARHLDDLQPVFKYVDDHLDGSMKMSELAALIGISEKYFISYFKKALGITPGQYIYQIKMNRARDYIYQKKYTVQEIAAFLGYPDPFSFSKAFKKYYKVPPSKFE